MEGVKGNDAQNRKRFGIGSPARAPAKEVLSFGPVPSPTRPISSHPTPRSLLLHPPSLRKHDAECRHIAPVGYVHEAARPCVTTLENPEI